MCFRWTLRCLFCILIILTSCAKRVYDVSYDDVQKTNRVEVVLVSGKKVEGTIVNVEPHQLTLLLKDRKVGRIAKSSIRSIRRRQPIYDDFGRGISEEEIESVQTNRNAIIYGVGGGALSVGISFFVGSTAGKDASNGGTILAASTIGGGGLGTYLFVRAGKGKDRKDAIETIRVKRRSEAVTEEKGGDQSLQELRDRLEEEKKKQEDLRKQREELLRELETKKKKEE
jgi:small nuclear ribonucleoprotein (snRNP)-like protein